MIDHLMDLASRELNCLKNNSDVCILQKTARLFCTLLLKAKGNIGVVGIFNWFIDLFKHMLSLKHDLNLSQ